VQDWLPHDHHARFIVDIIAQLDQAEWDLISIAWNLKRMHVFAKPRPKKAESAAKAALPTLHGAQMGLIQRIFAWQVKNDLKMFAKMSFSDFFSTGLSVARPTGC